MGNVSDRRAEGEGSAVCDSLVSGGDGWGKENHGSGTDSAGCPADRFLRYSLLEEADRGESPMITITYYRENQPAITVSANRNTVWWKGKSHVIRDPDMFVNLAEGIFFLEELPES